MAWLKENGFISSYEDYVRLPAGVLQDALMICNVQAAAARQKGGRSAR